jgi:DNA polymerase III subunit epsilon
MRLVILDTETTGLSPEEGHRIIEVGCVEVVNRKVTGRVFHRYLNPEREIDEGAFRVHGLSSQFLQDKPLFSEVAAELIDFVQGAEVVIHNAAFDVKFLDAELHRLDRFRSFANYCAIKDTLLMAREKHPGQKNNLDALCKRYKVDNTHRELHGALLDAHLLARVYLAMTGGQTRLLLDMNVAHSVEKSHASVARTQFLKESVDPLVVIAPTEDERAVHCLRVEKIIRKSGKDPSNRLYTQGHWSGR